MKKRHRTLLTVIFGLAGFAAVAALVLNAFSSNLVYFRSPSDVAEGKVNQTNSFRLGGMVREGSIERQSNTLKVSFVVTDYNHDVKVHYDGVLPDLFREGQGVVTEGSMDQDGLYTAHTVLAKHDENYMPPEVADALKKAGKTASGETLTPGLQPAE